MISLEQLLSTIAPVKLSLESKPLSAYSVIISKNIDTLISKVNSTATHTEKFKQTVNYLQTLRKHINDNRAVIVSLPFAKHIDVFNDELTKLIDLSSICTTQISQKTIDERPFISIWRTFLLFWLSSFKFLRFLDPANFFDPVPLCISHLNDLKYIRDHYNLNRERERALEIQQTLAVNPEDLDLKLVKTVEFERKNPFSLIFKVTAKNFFYSFEFFNPETDASLFFRKYVSILCMMAHPNISSFCGSTNALPYSVLTPHCKNGPLSSHLHNEEKKLSPTQESIIILDIARALEYIHSRKIVHRNITPDNIYLNENQNAVLNGFLNSCGDQNVQNQIPFNPYSAPELLLDPSYYNEKSDVYSFTVLVWEIYTGKVPFGEKSSYEAKNDIIFQDLRPHLPAEPSVVNFFICGWMRNPNNRPTMSEIVKSIERQEILIPETNTEQFASYVENTRRSHTAAMKGILQLTMDQLQQLGQNGNLDDTAVELLTNVYSDSNDENMKQYAKKLLISNLDRKQTLSIKSLVLYCSLSLLVKEIQPRVLAMCTVLPNRDEFIRLLFNTVDTTQAVEFIILFGIKSEEDCNMILEVAATQPPDIAEKTARAVINAFPQSTAIFDHAKKNPKYLMIALEHIKSLDNVSLNRNSKKIVMFVDDATPQLLGELNQLVLRLDVKTNLDFDPNCLLFKLLAKGGYQETIAKFATIPQYCQRFLKIMMASLINDQPSIALAIALNAKRFPDLQSELIQYNVLSLITNCVSLKHYEVAYQAAIKIKFTREELVKNFEEANKLVRLLEENQSDENTASSILMTFIPYVLYAEWSEKIIVPEITSHLLQSDSTLVASRALTFACSFAQNPIIARIMAIPVNLAATSRFFDSGSIPFTYLAVRFFAAIAPYMKASDQVEETVKKEIEMATTTYADNTRLVQVIVQSFLLVPKAEWGTLMSRCPIFDFVQHLEQSFSMNNEMMSLIYQLKNHQ